MRATLNVVTNPFNPNLDRVQKVIERKVKINALVQRHNIDLSKPVICYHNDAPVLRKDWSKRVIKDGDVISFITLPQGGGGSNPLRLVLTIALMYYAPIIGGNLMGAGTFGAQLVSAGITFVGSALINALIPPPQQPKPQQQTSLAAASPTYTLSAQGNQARIGQAIPVLYGRFNVFPDFAAQPYVEFQDNDQYLYQLFVITQGKAQIDFNDIYIENSPISSFDSGDFQYEVLQPGQSSTIYPTAVFNVPEVSGQEIDGDNVVGPFPVNPANTVINRVAFDLACPRGLYYANDEGGLSSTSVSAYFFITPIDELGNPTGPEQQIAVETISGATSTAIRKSYFYDVLPGRYLAKVTRGERKSTDSRFGDELNVVSIRGYSNEPIEYGNVTMLALKLKATNNISQQSSRKVNVIARRLLQTPTYNPETESYDWGNEIETRSIAWAIADMCRSEYGANIADSRVNIGQLINLHQIWESRGDEFSGIYDSAQTFWEAITLACRAGRARPYIQGGMINFVRDSLQSLPSAIFTSRNIVKGTFKVTYMMKSEDTADCVDVEYFDETVWKPRVVRAALDPLITTKPAKVKSFGITKRDQAYREGMNSAATNTYRRKEISFETELEGYIPSIGDLIGIQNDIPKWGQAADVVSYIGGVVTASESFKWTDGLNHYVMLRKRNGSASSVLQVVKGAKDNQFSFVGEAPDFALQTDFTQERTHISFGPTGNVIQLAKVLSITPRGNTVQITAINEDIRVHSADGGVVPEDLYNYGVQAPKTKPVLTDFSFTQTGSGNTPSVTLSWPTAVGASRYIIQKSTDGENWETLGEISTTSFSFTSQIGGVFIRIAAMGALLGPYVTKAVSIGAVPPPANVTSGSITSNDQSYNVKWSEVIDKDEYFVEVLNDGSVKRSFSTITNNFTYSLENAIADGGPWRAITVRVRAKKGTVYSVTPLILNGTNAAPSAPTVTLTPGQGNIAITVSPSGDRDYAGTLIHVSDTPDFTPAPENLVYDGLGNFYLLITDTTKYVKAAHYDTYGKTGLNYSTEANTSPSNNVGGIEVVDMLPDSGNFEGRVVYLTTTYTDITTAITYAGDKLYTYDADTSTWNTGGGGLPGAGQVTNEMLAGNITANKINVANLAAIKADMGAITAGSISLDNSGFIRGGMTAYGVGSGFYLGYEHASDNYVMAVGNDTQGWTWNGSVFTIKGDFVAGSININNKFSVNSAGNVTIRNAAIGARLEISNEVIKVYDENNVLRVKLGNLAL